MSIKKTWFSYILWLIATGFSVLFTYFAVSNVTKCYGIYGHNQTGFVIGYSVGLMTVVILLCLIIRKLCDRIYILKMNKWVARCLHALAFIGITGLFLYTRYFSFITGELHGDQMAVFFEMTRIGFIPEELEAMEVVLGNVSLVTSVFEGTYMKVLSIMFLFLGNKLELLESIQLIFQVVSLYSLCLIGWKVQKGIFAWIPALVYAGAPVYASMIGDFGPSNFWLCITLLGMVLIFLLQRIWKNRFVTYIVTTLWGICICVFVFSSKFGVLFKNAPTFFVESDIRVTIIALCTELLSWSIILQIYCVTFWFIKTDAVSLYVIPAALATGLLLALYHHECDVTFFLTIFIGFWMLLLGTEGLHLLCAAKPKVVTGQSKDCSFINENDSKNSERKEEDRKDFDWTEMKEIMDHKEEAVQTKVQIETLTKENSVPKENSVQEENDVSDDTGVIRVSDILKTLGADERESEMVSIEDMQMGETLDKTAMIENVLPMPKKHVSRSFEYSFEPTEDMMHYDVEVENDDYDYE